MYTQKEGEPENAATSFCTRSYLSILSIDKDVSCLPGFTVVIGYEHGIGASLHTWHFKGGVEMSEWNGLFGITILIRCRL